MIVICNQDVRGERPLSICNQVSFAIKMSEGKDVWENCVSIAGASIESYKAVAKQLLPLTFGRQIALCALTISISQRKPHIASAFWQEYTKVSEYVYKRMGGGGCNDMFKRRRRRRRRRANIRITPACKAYHSSFAL